MTDHLGVLRDRIAKTQAKVQRYQKSLESAEKELAELGIALRVIEGIANDSDSNGSGTSTTLGRQLDIVRLLGVGRENGRAPAAIYLRYCGHADEDITIDTFRTTIWRMKDRIFDVDGGTFWVHGEDGSYWKEQVIDLSHNPEALAYLGGAVDDEIEPTSESATGAGAREAFVSTPIREILLIDSVD